jgi:WD40 repeat protein
MPLAFALASDGKTLAASAMGFSLEKGRRNLAGLNPTDLEFALLFWDMKADRAGQWITLGQDAIVAVAYAPHGALLATAHFDGSVRLWDTVASGDQGGFRRPWGKVPGKARISFSAHQGLISWLSFSSDGTALLTGATNGTVKLWDAGTGQLRTSFKGHKDRICAALLTADGQTLITADAEGLVKFWGVDAPRGPRLFKGPKGVVGALQFTSDSRALICTGNHGQVQRFDLLSTRKHFTFELPAGPGAMSDDGRFVVAGDPKGLRLIETATGRDVPLPANLPKGRLWACALSADARRVAVLADADKGHELRVFELETGASVFTTRIDQALRKSLAFAPNGRLLALVDISGDIDVWDLETREKCCTLRNPPRPVRAIAAAFSPQSDYLACCDARSIYVFETRTWQKLWQAPTYWHHPMTLAFSRDGKRLATGGGEGELEVGGGVKLWDTSSGRELLTLGSSNIAFTRVAFSPDGARIAAAAMDPINIRPDQPGQIWIWEAPPGE